MPTNGSRLLYVESKADAALTLAHRNEERLGAQEERISRLEKVYWRVLLAAFAGSAASGGLEPLLSLLGL